MHYLRSSQKRNQRIDFWKNSDNSFRTYIGTYQIYGVHLLWIWCPYLTLLVPFRDLRDALLNPWATPRGSSLRPVSWGCVKARFTTHQKLVPWGSPRHSFSSFQPPPQHQPSPFPYQKGVPRDPPMVPLGLGYPTSNPSSALPPTHLPHH